ncbi:DNA repair protein [Microbacteriaceae bacterium VKM Ac-2855]|nr:DNA repair protein [Microbacteriaceae bacterium VKM Ac-2855]
MNVRMTELPTEERPRERLQASGPAALTDAEMIAILIGNGVRGANATAVAQTMLTRIGGVDALSRAAVTDLVRHPGIGPVAACRIVAAFELRRRMGRSMRARTVPDAAALATIAVPLLGDRAVASILIVVTDAEGRLRDTVTIAESSGAHPEAPAAEVLAAVLGRGGAAFGVAHNHPRGTAEPTLSDADATAALEAAAEACGVRLIAHLVIAGTDWTEA